MVSHQGCFQSAHSSTQVADLYFGNWPENPQQFPLAAHPPEGDGDAASLHSAADVPPPIILPFGMAKGLGKETGTKSLKQWHRASTGLHVNVVPSRVHQDSVPKHTGQFESVSKLPQLPNSQKVAKVYNRGEKVSNLCSASRQITQPSPGVDSVHTPKGLCLPVTQQMAIKRHGLWASDSFCDYITATCVQEAHVAATLAGCIETI